MKNLTTEQSIAGGIRGKLTDRAVKAFVAKSKPGKKLADGGGLHVFITPAGGTTWRVKYRIEGKERLYSVGPYPLVSLAAARVEPDSYPARFHGRIGVAWGSSIFCRKAHRALAPKPS